MSNVMRYNPVPTESGLIFDDIMSPHIEGEFVKYEDYDNLVNKYLELTENIKSLRSLGTPSAGDAEIRKQKLKEGKLASCLKR